MSEITVTTERVIQRIRAYASARNWRKSRLAREAGLRDTTLRDFDKPTWNPTLQTLEALEAVIPEDFASDATDEVAA